jgi:hypothetical protein
VDLEGCLRYPQRGAAEVMLAARTETEPLVVRGRSFKEDERHSSTSELLESVADQSRSDSGALAFRQHTDRTEHLDVDEPVWGVKQVAGEQNVSDKAVVDCNERESRFRGEGAPQVIDERHDDRAVISKCTLVDLRDTGLIVWTLFTYQHGATLCAAQGKGDPFCRSGRDPARPWLRCHV